MRHLLRGFTIAAILAGALMALAHAASPQIDMTLPPRDAGETVHGAALGSSLSDEGARLPGSHKRASAMTASENRAARQIWHVQPRGNRADDDTGRAAVPVHRVVRVNQTVNIARANSITDRLNRQALMRSERRGGYATPPQVAYAPPGYPPPWYPSP